MNIKAALTILSAAALLGLAGCQQEQAPQQSLTGGLTKTSASEIPGCPKYQKFIQNFATDIQTCSQQNVADCSPKLMKAFDPILECLGLDKPTIKTQADLIQMSKDIGDKVSEYDNNPSKAKDFVGCLCGTDGGAASVETQFTGSTNGTTSKFTGSTDGTSSKFNGSTEGVGGSFSGSVNGTTSAFGH